MWPHFNLTYGWHWATLQNLDDWATLQNLDALLLHGLQLWQNKAKTNSDWKDTLPLDTGSLHGLLMGKCSSCVFQLHKFVSLLAEISEGHDATSKSRYHDILIIKYTCTHTYICMHACILHRHSGPRSVSNHSLVWIVKYTTLKTTLSVQFFFLFFYLKNKSLKKTTTKSLP